MNTTSKTTKTTKTTNPKFVADQQRELHNAIGIETVAPINGRRLILATVGWLLTYAASFYWGMYALDIAIAALITLTGAGFIAFLISFIGIVAVMISAWLTASAVFRYITEFSIGDLRSAAIEIKDAGARRSALIFNWFSRKAV